jgi:hypothetical protein
MIWGHSELLKVAIKRNAVNESSVGRKREFRGRQ